MYKNYDEDTEFIDNMSDDCKENSIIVWSVLYKYGIQIIRRH